MPRATKDLLHRGRVLSDVGWRAAGWRAAGWRAALSGLVIYCSPRQICPHIHGTRCRVPLITNMYGNIYIFFNSSAKIDMHPVSVLPSWPWLALPASHATWPEGRGEREAPPSSNSPGAALLGPGRDLGCDVEGPVK